MRSAVLTLALAMAGTLAGCIGDIGGNDRPGDSTPSGGGDSGGNPDQDPTKHDGSLPLRRLTPFEIDRALFDLLGDDSHAAMALRPANVKAAYETDPKEQVVTRQTLEQMESIFFESARRATEDLPGRLGCEPAAAGDACIGGYLERFGRRAFRRTLGAQELQRWLDLQSSLDAPLGRNLAVARTLQAMLLSPDFLYLTAFGEDGPEGEDAALLPHELAGRLSFFVWGSVPDEALVDAAEQGKLSTPEGLAAELGRMLDDERAQGAAARFVANWLDVLDLGALPKSDGAWNAQLLGAVQQESIQAAAAWFGRGDAFGELLTSDTTFVNGPLASLYGLEGVDGDGFVEVAGMHERGRPGVLGQAGFLAAHATQGASSPTLRGKWVIERALCGSMGSPPSNAVSKAPQLEPGMTTRELHEIIETTEGCSGCHARMEPPGYVFEGFDAVGRARSTDAGKPVNTAATLVTGYEEVDGSYDDYRGMAAALAESEVARGCVARQWLSFALARPLDAADEAAAEAVGAALSESGTAAVEAIATHRVFVLARRSELKEEP